MANQFLSIPVPATTGVGASVDVSELAFIKTITVAVPHPYEGTIDIEFSNDAAGLSWNSIRSVANGTQFTVGIAARWMRVEVQNYRIGDPPTAMVASDTDTANVFINLPVTAGNGTGASVPVSLAAGVMKTVSVAGTFSGDVDIQISEDGTAWNSLRTFSSPSSETFRVVAAFMRAVRMGASSVPGTPSVDIGCASENVAGGGASTGSPAAIIYSADGTEGTDFTVTWPTPRASANYGVVALSQGGGGYVVAIDVPHADVTAASFRVITSAALAFGDAIVFHAIDLPDAPLV